MKRVWFKPPVKFTLTEQPVPAMAALDFDPANESDAHAACYRLGRDEAMKEVRAILRLSPEQTELLNWIDRPWQK